MLFSAKVPCSVASVALFCKLPQLYTNLKNVPFAMNKKTGIGKSKPKHSQRSAESTLEMPVGRAYAVESLAVGKVLRIPSLSPSIRGGFEYVMFSFESAGGFKFIR